MEKLSAEQIARYAYDAGFRGHGLSTAVAVALAESGGNPRAHNGVPPDNSYGLWQINMIGSLGPDRRHQFHLDSNGELFDPAANARAANAISGDGANFGPWTTYTSGAYRQYLHQARVAAHEATRSHGHGGATPPSGGHHPGGNGHHGQQGNGHGNGHHGGFAVDTALLDAYAKQTKHIAAELATLSNTQVRRVRTIADDSFGKIGKESGFADALDSFGAALQRQVKGVGGNAGSLATSTARSSRTYRNTDDEAGATLDGIG